MSWLALITNRYVLGALGALILSSSLFFWGYHSAARECKAGLLRQELAAARDRLTAARQQFDDIAKDYAAQKELSDRLSVENETIHTDLDAALKRIKANASYAPACTPDPLTLRLLARAVTGQDPLPPAARNDAAAP